MAKKSGDWRWDADRYLRINAWLQARYRRADGLLVTHERGMVASRYTRLDIGFFLRYVSDFHYAAGFIDGEWRVYRDGRVLPQRYPSKESAEFDARARNAGEIDDALKAANEPSDYDEYVRDNRLTQRELI